MRRTELQKQQRKNMNIKDNSDSEIIRKSEKSESGMDATQTRRSDVSNQPSNFSV